MSEPIDWQIQPGPCASCGATNYALSFGGPSICPMCDCSPPSMRQVRHLIERAEKAEADLRALRETDAEIDSDRHRLIAENQRLRDALAGMLDQPEDAASYDAMMRRAQEALGLRKESREKRWGYNTEEGEKGDAE